MQEYYDIPSLRWIFQTVGAVPVPGDGRDAAAVRAALRVLKSGNVLGIFPEGGLSPSRALRPFAPGAAIIASRAGVPIIPAYIWGTHRRQSHLAGYLVPQEATVAFGPPIPTRHRDPVAVAQELRRAIVALGLAVYPNRWELIDGENQPGQTVPAIRSSDKG